jgi:hypothetical protein
MPPDLVALGDLLEAAAARALARRRTRRQLVLNATAGVALAVPLALAVSTTTLTTAVPTPTPTAHQRVVAVDDPLRAPQVPPSPASPRLPGANLPRETVRLRPDLGPSTLRPALR